MSYPKRKSCRPKSPYTLVISIVHGASRVSDRVEGEFQISASNLRDRRARAQLRKDEPSNELDVLLVSRKNLAVLLGISLRTVDRLVTLGELHTIHKGRRVLFHRNEVTNFVNRYSATSGTTKVMRIGEPLLLSRQRVAVVLEKSLRTIDNLVARGALQIVRVGRRVLFDPWTLDSYGSEYHQAKAKKAKS
jgi:excisionase family DNA binding protein